MALLQMSNMAAVTLSPLVGTAVVQARGAGAVFLLSAVPALLNLLLAETVPETQAPGQAVPVSSQRGGWLRAVNPLGWVSLFLRGRRL